MLADRLDVQVAARLVHGLRPGRDHVGDLGIAAQEARQAEDGDAHLAVGRTAGPPGVDHDVGRSQRALADRLGQDVEPLDGLEVLRNALVRAWAELEGEHRRREQQQGRSRPGGEGIRALHDPVRQPRPEVALGVLAPLDHPLRDQAHAVHPVLEPVDEHGQQRDRGGHRHERDQ